VADHIVSLDNLDGYNEQSISNLVWAYHKAGIICQDLNDNFIGAAVDRKEEFGTKRLETLNRWMSEEEGTQIKEDEHDKDENDSVAVDNDNDRKDEALVLVEEKEDSTFPVPEDLSLLTVVQLKDRLRNLGLPVSGRKHELIDRLNDHFQL